MDIRGIELRREVQQALLFRVRHVERGGGRGPGLADEEQVTPQRGQFAEEKAEIHATLQQFLRQRGNGEAVLSLECVEKALIKLLSGKAEHAAGGGFGQVVAAEGQRLAEQGHAVAHASGGTARKEADGVFLERDAFLVEHARQMGHQFGFGDGLENEMLAAADDRDRKFVGLGGGEDERCAWRRLFQRLEQGVEGFAREHVRFVDDEDLVAAFHRRVGDGLAQAAGVVDAAVGRAVDFHHVHVVAHRDAAGTGSHWLQGSPVGACTQFSALAKIRAMVVLPTPRVPLSR